MSSNRGSIQLYHFGRVSASTSGARRNGQREEKLRDLALKEVNESSGAHEVFFRFRHSRADQGAFKFLAVIVPR